MKKRTNKNDKWKSVIGGRNRKPRAKTFLTESAAHAFAKAEGLSNYTLQNLRNSESKTKKLRIVEN